MKLRTTYILSVFILLACSVLIGCSFSETRSKDPVFGPDTARLEKDLTRLITCEHINLDGKEVTTNGKSKSQLEISVINGQNLPTIEDQLKMLGKSIGSYIKKALKDNNEYDNYTVLFVSKKTESGVTTNNSNGFTYKAEEL